jgi:tetratricopeptide (TPR) repeat protein
MSALFGSATSRAYCDASFHSLERKPSVVPPDSIKGSTETVQRAIVLDPCNPALYRLVVEALQSEPPVDAAVIFCRRWLLLEPVSAPAAIFYAFFEEQRNDARRAEALYARATCSDPKLVDAISALADFLFLSGRGAAGRWYQRAMSIEPTAAKLLNNYSVFLQGSGDFKGAGRLADAAVLLNPALAEALLNLAGIEVERGHIKSAIRLLFWAERVNPSSLVIKSNLGFLLLQAGRYAEGWAYHEWRSLDGIQAGDPPVQEKVLSGLAVVRA